MGKYTVYLPGGGSEEVNASSPSAALGNVGGGSLTPPSAPSAPSSSGGGSQPAPAPAPASSGGGGSGYGANQGFWSTVNGPRTIPQMAAELAAVGYNGPTDPGSILGAYGRTTKGAVGPDNTDNLPGGGGPTQQALQQQQQPAQPGLGDSIDKLLAALASGNQAAAAEAAREFNATFGLDQTKFAEAVKEYGQNFGLQQAAVTGTYNGTATLAAQKQAADIAAQAAGLSGVFNGAPTEAAREFNANTGMEALKEEASLQADPFKQQQYINGLNASGYSNAIDALKGTGNQPAFQAPTGNSPASSATLAGTLDRIQGNDAGSAAFNPGSTADGASAASASGGGTGSSDNAQMNASLAALPAPNKIVGRNFLKEDPTTQQFVLSGLSASNGLDQNTNKSIIQAGMPTFDAPTGMVDAT